MRDWEVYYGIFIFILFFYQKHVYFFSIFLWKGEGEGSKKEEKGERTKTHMTPFHSPFMSHTVTQHKHVINIFKFPSVFVLNWSPPNAKGSRVFEVKRRKRSKIKNHSYSFLISSEYAKCKVQTASCHCTGYGLVRSDGYERNANHTSWQRLRCQWYEFRDFNQFQWINSKNLFSNK